VSHLTLAHVGASLPPHIKFLISALTWLHILGSGFQHAARYQVDAKRTWFATSVFPASESLLLLQLISLPLRANIIVSKFASGGKWNPTWIPRYLVFFPFVIHLSPSSSPHSQDFSLWLAQITADLRQLTLAPDAWQKVLRTSYAMSMLARVPFK
jgi:hypothetical protein